MRWSAASAHDAHDRQQHDGADRRADEPGRLSRLVEVQCLAAVCGNQRAGNAQHCGEDKSELVVARMDRACDQAHDEADDDRSDDVHGYSAGSRTHFECGHPCGFPGGHQGPYKGTEMVGGATCPVLAEIGHER